MMRQIIVAWSVSTLCMLEVSAADWPHWRGPNHDGISTETGWQAVWPPQGPRRLWKAEVGTGFASVSVSAGRVLTVGNESNQDTIYCFAAESGEELWRYSYRHGRDAKYYEGGPSATPTVDGDRVYTLSKRGEVHCLDARTGVVLWQRDLPEELDVKAPTWGFAGSLYVTGDLVVLNVGEAGTALNKLTGDTVWSSGRGPGGYSTPVPFQSGGDAALALMGAEALIAVRVSDGKSLWQFPWNTAHDVNAADPVIEGDRFLISSGYGKGCALVRVTGSQPTVLWQNKNLRSHFATAVIWKGHAYGVDENELVCLDLGSGAVRWRERSLGKGSLMMADGKIIALSDKGELWVVEASLSAFKAISRAQVLGGKCWTVPVLANGLIYCRNAKGDLVCLDVRGR